MSRVSGHSSRKKENDYRIHQHKAKKFQTFKAKYLAVSVLVILVMLVLEEMVRPQWEAPCSPVNLVVLGLAVLSLNNDIKYLIITNN